MLDMNWTINGELRTRGYWLADGIYPDWPIFLKTIHDPTNKKEENFAAKQESVRKDVERAFGVLLARWHIICNASRLWDVHSMDMIMRACIILHNMILEYEENGSGEPPMDDYVSHDDISIEIFNRSDDEPDVLEPGTIAYFLQMMHIRRELKDSNEYFKQRDEICNHLWTLKGSE